MKKIFLIKIIYYSSYQNNDCVELKNNIPRYRVKYLHFDPNEYRRPPYYGTWRKRSNVIKPTNPLSKDTVCTHFIFKKHYFYEFFLL
jgi:hypothetical protein